MENKKDSSLVTLSQSIELRANKTFMDFVDGLNTYAAEHNIRKVKKGDLLTKVILKSELLKMTPEEFFK